MQFIRMMTAAVFDATGFCVCLLIRPTCSHAIALVQLMQKNISSFLLDDRVIDPYFLFRNKLIDIVVTAGGEINIKYAAHQSSIDDPDRQTVFQLLP
jgi:hypothetical protein